MVLCTNTPLAKPANHECTAWRFADRRQTEDHGATRIEEGADLFLGLGLSRALLPPAA